MHLKLMFLHALTPVHAGTGSGEGVIDLPIAREKSTGFPLIPASSLKGVLRDATDLPGEEADAIFGARENAGTLAIGDQRILFLPVRSYNGVFAWVTCPLVLERLARLTGTASTDLAFLAKVPPVPDQGEELCALVSSGSEILSGAKIYLEDIDIAARESDEADRLAAGFDKLVFGGVENLKARIAIVSNTVFSFLCETATEVAARICLELDTKTVRTGGLWYEEAAPAETIFCGPIAVDRRGDAAQTAAILAKVSHLQVGGDASIGRGLCAVTVHAI